MYLNPADVDFRQTATPTLTAHYTKGGWIWYAKIPGVLSHSPEQTGPFYETPKLALAAGLTVYPNGVIALVHAITPFG